jgi:hypothetical protein
MNPNTITDHGAKQVIAQNITSFYNTIEGSVRRVAQLGNWPGETKMHIDALLGRVPREDNVASGFDAGIAVALGLTTIDGQEFGRLSASMHTDPTENDYTEVRQGIGRIERGDMRNDTAFWLLGSLVCDDGYQGVDQEQFVRQVQKYNELQDSMFSTSDGRATQIQNILLDSVKNMKSGYIQMDDGVVFAEDNAALIGAYIDGHKFGVFPGGGLFYIGSYLPSLGLEDFKFGTSTEMVNGDVKTKSGFVHEGSYNFIKCATIGELSRAVDIVKSNLL